MKSYANYGLIIFAMLVISQVWNSKVFSQHTDSGYAVEPASPTTLRSPAGNDSNPVGKGETIIPQDFQVSPQQVVGVKGTRTVYFTPMDENTSATVLFVYNTGDANATVPLQTFGLDGALNIDTTISVPAHSMVRICSDTVSTISSTWENVVLANFTTYSTYAKMILPDGVGVDGYVVWNNSDTYDPLLVAPTLKTGFMQDQSRPTTVYFTPQDENTSVTVLFFYNTGDTNVTVPLQTFGLDGSLYIDTTISVPAHSMVRVASDTVSSISSTWQNVVLANFTTFSTYAKMILPAGVKVYGYVAWNGGNTYDPLAVVPAMEIGFSPDPPPSTIFLMINSILSTNRRE